MNCSLFKVYYAPSSSTPIDNRVNLGTATLSGSNPHFHPGRDAQDFFIKQPLDWLVPFRRNVRQMVRSVGHGGKFSCLWNEKTGIGIERE